MLGGGEDAARIVDADDLVGRRGEKQQCLAQAAVVLEQHVLGAVVAGRTLCAKLPAAERDLDLALCADLVRRLLEQAGARGGVAAIVTTARASATCDAAASTAVPPRLWPIRIAGARRLRRNSSAAATRSATLEENVVLANSPSLAPSPVKSKRSTAMPSAVRPS